MNEEKNKTCNNHIKKRPLRHTQKEIIEYFIKTHGDRYDYSNIIYTGVANKVDIICKKHGLFKQNIRNHINGQGCPKCRADNLSEKFRMSINEIIEKANKIHYGRYKYDIQIQPKNNQQKINIICDKHGIFSIKINTHLNGIGCAKCNCSKGELKIIQYLEKNNIKYEYQKKFPSCKNINELPFDFFLPYFCVLIELDGKQHFIPYCRTPDNYNKLNNIQKNDEIKNNWAKTNNIPLLRINDINFIDTILYQFLSKLNINNSTNILELEKFKHEEDIIKDYINNESLQFLSEKYLYSINKIKIILKKNNIKIRNSRKGIKYNIKNPRKSYKKFYHCLAEKFGNCSKTSSGYRNGIIDINGNKIRDFNYKIFKECLAKDKNSGYCTKRIAGRFCKRHYRLYYNEIIDKNGSLIIYENS